MNRIAHRLLTGLLLATGPAWAESECWSRYFGDPGSVITDMATGKDGLWLAGRLEEAGASPTLWLALLDWQGQAKWQARLPL